MEIFKKLSFGGIAKELLIKQLAGSGVRFNDYAQTLFSHRLFAPEGKIEELSLVKLKLTDLGLSEPISYKTLIARASEHGLAPCPLALGAFLRLAYLDQPVGPYLTIASPILEEEESYPTGFYLRNFDSSLWLRGYRAIGDTEWPKENEFVFLG